MQHYTPTFTSQLGASYAAAYGSSLRHSRIGAQPHAYASFRRAPAGWSTAAEQDERTPRSQALSPRSVVVSPDGGRVLVDRRVLTEIHDSSGAFRAKRHHAVGVVEYNDADLSVSNESFFRCGWEYRWDLSSATGYDARGVELAARSEGTRRLTAVNGEEVYVQMPYESSVPPDRKNVEVESRQEATTFWGGVGNFRESIDGVGAAAAVSADWHLVVALTLGRLIVFAPTGTSDGRGIYLTDTTLPYRPDLLSIIPPLVLILSNTDSTSTLHAVDGAGREQWSAAIPFKALQPPIDGADGRVVVAGHGLAAVERGQVVWSFPWQKPVRATAFVDGTLAVATGGELRILDRAGQTRQRFQVEAGEEITTPPAIGPDGAVWVATAEALYVAR